MESTFDSFWFEVLMSLVSLLLMAALGALRQWLQKRFTAEQIQTGAEVARLAVQAVEQIWAKLPGGGGAQKLHEAIQHARKLGERHGVKFTDEQWKTLLEAAVHEMNRAKIDLGIITPTQPPDPIDGAEVGRSLARAVTRAKQNT